MKPLSASAGERVAARQGEVSPAKPSSPFPIKPNSSQPRETQSFYADSPRVSHFTRLPPSLACEVVSQPPPPNPLLPGARLRFTMSAVQPAKLETLDDLLAQAEHYADYSMRNMGRMPTTLFLNSL